MAEIRINTTGELKLYDSDSSNYVSFKSAGTAIGGLTTGSATSFTNITEEFSGTVTLKTVTDS